MAQQAKVNTALISDNLFLGPQQSMTISWGIDNNNVWWFHAVPKISQSSFPRNIQIDKVRIATTESTKFRAYIKITNPDPPMPTQEGWADGCYFRLYVAVATPI